VRIRPCSSLRLRTPPLVACQRVHSVEVLTLLEQPQQCEVSIAARREAPFSQRALERFAVFRLGLIGTILHLEQLAPVRHNQTFGGSSHAAATENPSASLNRRWCAYTYQETKRDKRAALCSLPACERAFPLRALPNRDEWLAPYSAFGATRSFAVEMTRRPLDTTPLRSALMKRVRRSGTVPELLVRRTLFRLGARYRVGVKGLPGSPDIASRARLKAIFVHGCFWHGHRKCRLAKLPKRNREFWRKKLRDNRTRDMAKIHALEASGFDVLELWQCELGDPGRLQARLKHFWFTRKQ
jgi:DNA mismatch endonuclease, patch repair protein